MTDKIKKAGTLSTVKDNSELAKMYEDNASVGSENLNPQSPILKVHSTGKSSSNELADGKEPTNGYFFYKPTGEEFKEVECHILTISKGFRTKGLEEGKNTFNQLLSGIIINDGVFQPFIIYLTGLKLQKMWDFGKEASSYTKAKPVPIPMFALKIKLTTEKVKTDYGNAWIINFEIMKDKEDHVVIVTDIKLFKSLKASVEKAKSMIASIISAKSIEKEEVIKVKEVVERDDSSNKLEDQPDGKEDFDPNEIPF